MSFFSRKKSSLQYFPAKKYDCAIFSYDFLMTSGLFLVIILIPKLLLQGGVIMARVCIPDYEYQERIQRAAKLLRAKGLDVMVVASTESDYANARYFSGFWPLFERAGVAISANGDAALLVGPESAVFGKD